MITIKKGLNLPITGDPKEEISEGNEVTSVGVIGPDFHGMKPTMAVQVGESVKLGQVLFSDKKNPGVVYTSPGSGKVIAINRGEKRVLESVVVGLEGNDAVQFESYSEDKLSDLSREQIQSNLVDSGMWTSFRTRPFNKVPAIDSVPNSIFITAMDTNPLAAKPSIVIDFDRQNFINGLKLVCKLSGGKTYLCKQTGIKIAGSDLPCIETKEFSGVHPAGLPGTHIHFVDPVSDKKTVWFINYQDVIAIGALFTSGTLYTQRVVSLAGPAVIKPRYIRTRMGARIKELIHNEVQGKDLRPISGSVLSGRGGDGVYSYLGKYHLQISVLSEGRKRELLGWMVAGFNKFSIKNVFLSKLFPNKKFDFNTSTGGSERAIVPIGMYEQVMPLDIEPTFLLRSLIVGDSDQAQLLGCLELDEEDLGLCTFVCPGKYNYGSILRSNLTKIEREG